MSGRESKHEFALYVPTLTALLNGVRESRRISINDSALVHRIQGVLRLMPGETITFFDRNEHVQCSLQAVSKKEVVCTVLQQHKHTTLQPTITFFLPLLKKEDLETALYSLVELGANQVYLVETEKSRHRMPKEREVAEFDRLERVMIAAAEQSKQFALPTLHAPILFAELIEQVSKTDVPCIFFDPDGRDLFTVIAELREQKPRAVFLLVGPEGDLTPQEKALLGGVQVRLCKLTPTVLRSVSAVSVGIGVVRSVV